MAEELNKPPSVQLSEITSRLFANCFEKETRHASDFGVSIVESRCLRVLRENVNLAVNQLAKKMSLSSSRITRVIDGLVEKKLVERTTAENDRRKYLLSLTPKGVKRAASIVESHEKIHEDILNSIPQKFQKQIIQSIEQLNYAMEIWLTTK